MEMEFGVGYEPLEAVNESNNRTMAASSAHKTNSAPQRSQFRGFLTDTTGEYE